MYIHIFIYSYIYLRPALLAGGGRAADRQRQRSGRLRAGRVYGQFSYFQIAKFQIERLKS